MAAAAAVLSAFVDYDCALAGTKPGAVVDWNSVFQGVRASLAAPNPVNSNFSFPEELGFLVLEQVPGSQSAAALAECPLGVLFLLILHFYSVGRGEIDDHAREASQIQSILTTYPTYVLALTRWPVFPALAHFSQFYHTNDEAALCDGVAGVTNWGPCRLLGMEWIEQYYMEDNPDRNSTLDALLVDSLDCSDDIMQSAQTLSRARDECPLGHLFYTATGLIMAAGAGRFTDDLPPYAKVVDQAIRALPFHVVSLSPWPIWHVLCIFADMNKGAWFWGGDRKYMRLFSDWNLRNDELSPLASPDNIFLSSKWREEVSKKVDFLVQMDHESFVETLHVEARRREDRWGPLRPIVRSLIDAAQAVASALEWQGLPRRMAYVVLLYKEAWAYLLERMVQHMSRLHVKYPLLVIAIGEDAADVCRKQAFANAPGASLQVICWVPDTMSQVHRFTCIHGLLHLGIDVLYTDMDTFWLRDPTQRIFSSAAEWDAVFARHADADCINIGVFYLRASGTLALWMSQFMAWYHDHPFEIDQRGLHIFLGLPAENMKISYSPKDLVRIRGTVLDDTNEVVIGRVRWMGALPKMLIFHWCHEPIETKEGELNAAYDASDILEPHNLPVSLALAVVSNANSGTPWAPVLKLRHIFDAYRTEAPILRTPCW